jgi:hypothetical protein
MKKGKMTLTVMFLCTRGGAEHLACVAYPVLTRASEMGMMVSISRHETRAKPRPVCTRAHALNMGWLV